MTMRQNELSVTGDCWLGRNGADSVLNTLRTVLNGAAGSVKMTAYSLTYNREFFDMLDDVLKRNIPVTLVINRYEKPDFDAVRGRIAGMDMEYPNFAVKSFNPKEGDLHAKIVVVDHHLDGCQALIGSANLSWSGIAKNHEIMIRLHGDPADAVGDMFELVSREAAEVTGRG